MTLGQDSLVFVCCRHGNSVCLFHEARVFSWELTWREKSRGFR